MVTAPPAPVEPDAATILARMEEAYATSTTYTDHGRAVSTYPDGSDDRVAFSTVFVRDLRLRFEVEGSAGGGTSRDWVMVWSDFLRTFTQTRGGRDTVDHGLRIADALQTAGHMTFGVVPELIPGVAAPLVRMLSTTSSLGHELVDGHDCWRITGEDGDGQPVVVWIDRASYLVRKRTMMVGDIHSTITLEPVVGAPIDPGSVVTTGTTVVTPLTRKPSPPRPRLGLRFGFQKATVTQVPAGSAAATAGVLVGDEIVAVDGKPISRGVELYARVLKEPAGTPFRITLSRDGKERDLTLVSAVDVFAKHVFEAESLIDAPAPAFDLAISAGAGPAKLDQLAGKVVILDFWSSWCEACLSSLPDLKRLAQAHPGLQVIAVSSDTEDIIRKQAVELGTPFVFASDPVGKAKALFHVSSYPHVVLIDRSGNVRYVEIGKRTESPLASYVEALLR